MRAAVLLAIAVFACAACAPEAERRSFPLWLSAEPPEGANERGWEISLTHAFVRVGPVTFWEGEVLLAGRSEDGIRAAAVSPHPGHYVPGEARAEWLETVSVDLLGPPMEAGVANGVTGNYGSLELALLPAEDDLDPNLPAGHSLRLEGTARSADQEVPFSVTLPWAQPVSAIPFPHELGLEPGGVELQLRLGEWLARVDFATAGSLDASFPPGSQAHNALTRGVADPASYRASWRPLQ